MLLLPCAVWLLVGASPTWKLTTEHRLAPREVSHTTLPSLSWVISSEGSCLSSANRACRQTSYLVQMVECFNTRCIVNQSVCNSTTNVVSSESVLVPANNYCADLALKPDSSYAWRVRLTIQSGISSEGLFWSPWASFSTALAPKGWNSSATWVSGGMTLATSLRNLDSPTAASNPNSDAHGVAKVCGTANGCTDGGMFLACSKPGGHSKC